MYKRAKDVGTSEIGVNPTKVRDLLGHPVECTDDNNPYLLNRTQDMAFLWPTKSLVVLHVERSMIWAVGPPPFIAWAETSMLPSGDHPEKIVKIWNI